MSIMQNSKLSKKHYKKFDMKMITKKLHLLEPSLELNKMRHLRKVLRRREIKEMTPSGQDLIQLSLELVKVKSYSI